MLDVFHLTTPLHWKAFSHPLRQKLLLLVHEKEMTNAELAAEMGIPSGQLHFHTRQLLSAGLIEIAGTRMRGPITEKLYRAAARRYASEQVPAGIGLPLEPSFEIGLDVYRRRGQQATEAPSSAFCLIVPMSRDVAEQFRARIEQLQQDLITQSENTRTTDNDLYAFTTVMHRVSRDQSDSKSPERGDKDDTK